MFRTFPLVCIVMAYHLKENSNNIIYTTVDIFDITIIIIIIIIPNVAGCLECHKRFVPAAEFVRILFLSLLNACATSSDAYDLL